MNTRQFRDFYLHRSKFCAIIVSNESEVSAMDALTRTEQKSSIRKLLWLGFIGSCLSLICDFLLGWMVYP